MTQPIRESERESENELAIASPPDADPSPATPSSNRPWWIALGVALVLLGGGIGWRLFLGMQAGPPGFMQGQGLPVQLAAVEEEEIVETSEFVGSLESRNSVTIRPEVEGRIVEIYARPGQMVEAGTPLVQLSPDEEEADLASLLASTNSARAVRASAASQLEALEADRLASLAEVNLQETEYNRTAVLVEEGAFAEQELDLAQRNLESAIANLNALDRRIDAAQANLVESEAALEQSQANAASANARLQDTVIYAPFRGMVGDIPVKLGDVVSQSDTLTSVTQNQVLELRLSVPVERRPQLRQGLLVELVDNQGEAIARGQVSFISPQVEPGAQTILAKASFQNANSLLLDGQAVRARIIWNREQGVLVPTSAISRIAGQTFVYVAVPAPETPPGAEGPALIAEQRLVELGDIQGNRYQVISGLEAGEQLIVSGILNLADGVPVMPTAPGDPAAAPAGGN